MTMQASNNTGSKNGLATGLAKVRPKEIFQIYSVMGRYIIENQNNNEERNYV